MNYLSLINEDLRNQILINLDLQSLNNVIKTFKLYIDYLDLFRYKFIKTYILSIKLNNLFNVNIKNFYEFLLQIEYKDNFKFLKDYSDIFSGNYYTECINMVYLIFIYRDDPYYVTMDWPKYILNWYCIYVALNNINDPVTDIKNVIKLYKNRPIKDFIEYITSNVGLFYYTICIYIFIHELNWNISNDDKKYINSILINRYNIIRDFQNIYDLSDELGYDKILLDYIELKLKLYY